MENENQIKITQQTVNKIDDTNPEHNLHATKNKLLRVMQAKTKKQKSKTNRLMIKTNKIIIRDKEQNNHEVDCEHLKEDGVSSNNEDTRTYHEGTSCQQDPQTNQVREAVDSGKLTKLPFWSFVVKTEVKTEPLRCKINLLTIELSDGRRQITQEATTTLESINKTCIKTMTISKFYDHILSGGVELLDVNSSRTIFFENLKKSDIWNETTLKEKLPSMQFITQEDPTGDMAKIEHITKLTEAEAPSYQHDEYAVYRLSTLVKILSIEYTSEGLEKLKLGYLCDQRRESQHSTDLDNDCPNDESNDYVATCYDVNTSLHKSKWTRKIKGEDLMAYIFRGDGKTIILNLLAYMVAIVFQLVQSVINLMLSKRSCIDLWKQIKPHDNERLDETTECPDSSWLVKTTIKTWSTLKYSVEKMIENQDCNGDEEHKSGRVSKIDANIQESDVPKQKITYIAKLRHIMDDVRNKDPAIYYSVGTKHRKKEKSNQSQEQSRLETNLTQKEVDHMLVALNKSLLARTLERLQRKEQLHTIIVISTSNSLDMNYFLEYQDEPDNESTMMETILLLGHLCVNIFIDQADVPIWVISEGENELVNTLLKSLLKIWNIKCVSTTPRYPNSEEFVKNHNNMLRVQSYNRIDTKKQDKWDLFLPIVKLLYNTTVSQSTGCVPMKLMKGRENIITFFNHRDSIVGDLRLKTLNHKYVRKLVESNDRYHCFAIEKAKKGKLQFEVQVRQKLRSVDDESAQVFLLIRSPVHKFKLTNKMEAYKILMVWLTRCEGLCVIKKQCHLWLR